MNTVLPGRLYQRGQILTWTREEKAQLFAELGIRRVVNLWPKLDPDLAELGLDWYLYLPVARSADMLSPRVQLAAWAVAMLLRQEPTVPALLLCEAGRTRSVCFSTLVMRWLLDTSFSEAYRHVTAAIPDHDLKRFMVEFFTSDGGG